MDILEKFQEIKHHFESSFQNHSPDKKFIEDLDQFEKLLKDKIRAIDLETTDYKKLVENAEDYMFITSGEGTILSANAAACKKYKIPIDEFVGSSVLKIDTSNNAGEIMQNVGELILTGNTRFEAVHKSRVGETFNVDVIAQRIFWKNEEAFIFACRDITKQKQLQKALNESEAKLKKIINQISDGIIIYEKNGKIIIWNRGAEKITGIKKEDATGRIIYELQYELLTGKLKNKRLIKERFDEIVNMTRPEVFDKLAENDISVGNNEIKTVQEIVFHIDLDFENQLFGSVIRDATELKIAETQLMELNETRDKIYSVIAHDLRTPFNSIIGFTDLLLNNFEKYQDEKVRSILQYINLSARPMLDVLTNLLQWVTTQTGQMDFHPEAFHLDKVVKEVLEMMNLTAKIKNITLNNCLDHDYFVLADVNMVKSVLQNLIANAIKFSYAGGKVEINARQVNNFIELEVADEGVGIDEQKLGAILNEDRHESTKGTSGEKGSGLGLILCKEFVEKHGGEIRVESMPGEGSRFLFTVPLAEEKLDQ